jgi:hypothetical protein
VDLPNILDVGTAWRGIDRILYDIVNRFNIPQKRCLEFGVAARLLNFRLGERV